MWFSTKIQKEEKTKWNKFLSQLKVSESNRIISQLGLNEYMYLFKGILEIKPQG